MIWEEAIEQAKEEYGIFGWVSRDEWDSVVGLAKEILLEETKKITRWEHLDYLKSNEWKIKRESILKRDNYLCQECLKLVPSIFKLFEKIEYVPFEYKIAAEEVHHLDYAYKQTPQEELHCISLCKLHHELAHATTTYGYNWLKEKIEDNLIFGIYNKIINQLEYIKEINNQHQDFLMSLVQNQN